MLSLYDRATVEAALAQLSDPELIALIASRWALAEDNGLAELTHILVIQAGDDETVIEGEVGFSPLVNPIDGHRFGQADFQPFWSWLQGIGGWFEMIMTGGDSGFAYVLLIENAEGLTPDLQHLCQGYASCA